MNELILMTFLLLAGNLWFAEGYKCSFKADDDYPHEYICLVIPDLSEHSEKHNFGTTDDNVETVKFDSSLHNISYFTQSESTPFYQRFQYLKKIIVTGYKLKSIDEKSFENCTYINVIDFIRTDIQEFSENLFFENSNLKDLKLSDNKLTTLPENIFARLTELEFIDLSSNPFIFLPPNIFKPLRKLKGLYLDSINLKINPKWFKDFKRLIWLSLKNNKISDLPQNIFSSLKSLSSLDLSSNQLTVIHSDSFFMHPSLETVYLYNNSINAIDEKFIDNTGSYWIDMRLNNCNQEWITKRNEVKDKLAMCFNNYRPRQKQEEGKNIKFSQKK